MALRLPGPIPSLSRRALAGGLLALSLLCWLTPKALALLGQPQGAASSHAGHPLRQPTAVTNGLVAWYPLDGNANDYSGNNNSGTPNNFTFDGTTNGWTGGKFGKGLLFNGSNDYIVPSNPAQFNLTGSITVSAWVNPNSLSSVNNTIFEKGYDTTVEPYALRIDSINGTQANIDFGSYNGSNYYATGTVLKSALIGGWHLVTGIFDGSAYRVFLDGTLLNSFSTTQGPFSNSLGVQIGASYIQSGGGISRYFSGSIDDVRIYNRALSAAEVTQLYQSSQPINCDQYCVGWWKLDEASGTTASDSTANGANGNNGTLTNFTFDNTTNGWTSGVFGNALQLNGSNTFVSIPNSTSLSLSSAATFTAWVNTNIGGRDILDKSTGNNTVNYRFFIGAQGVSSDFHLGVWNGGSAALSSGSIPAGSWVYVAATVVGGVATFYANGQNIGSGSFSLGSGNSAPLVLGSGSNNYFFNGKLDDVRIYARALTDYEIYDQYSAGR